MKGIGNARDSWRLTSDSDTVDKPVTADLCICVSSSPTTQIGRTCIIGTYDICIDHHDSKITSKGHG